MRDRGNHVCVRAMKSGLYRAFFSGEMGSFSTVDECPLAAVAETLRVMSGRGRQGGMADELYREDMGLAND